MTSELRPQSAAETAGLVREAAESGAGLRIRGGGTRSGLGRPVNDGRVLSTAGLAGITLHEPAEMVIGARAGTALAEIEAALADKGQMLAFEPMDHRSLYFTSGTPSIGAIAAGNLSGPRRLWGGACRDSLIGATFVNGAGEIIRSGGRVMKNVTGLDLVKLQAGAWGTLGVLTEVIFKVVPKPEVVATLELEGLDEARAVAAMIKAVGSPFEITGAAHLAAAGGTPSRTLLRIEGFGFSVEYRAGELAKWLASFGSLTRLDDAEGAALWRAIRDAAPLAEPPERAIWRLSLKPSAAPGALATVRRERPAAALIDWGGGLVWLATDAAGDAGAAAIRAAARAASGYATLVRAPEAVRAAVEVFEPEAPAIAAISARIKASIDPAGLFNPGLMRAGV